MSKTGLGSADASRADPMAGKYSTIVLKVTVTVEEGDSPDIHTCNGEKPDVALVLKRGIDPAPL
jgi:hypothetical protein